MEMQSPCDAFEVSTITAAPKFLHGLSTNWDLRLKAWAGACKVRTRRPRIFWFDTICESSPQSFCGSSTQSESTVGKSLAPHPHPNSEQSDLESKREDRMRVKYLQCYPLTTLPTSLFGKAGRAFAKTKFYTVEKQTDRMLNFPEPKKKKEKRGGGWNRARASRADRMNQRDQWQHGGGKPFWQAARMRQSSYCVHSRSILPTQPDKPFQSIMNNSGKLATNVLHLAAQPSHLGWLLNVLAESELLLNSELSRFGLHGAVIQACHIRIGSMHDE